MKSFNYSEKTALITGASSGIGLEFAEQLAARGVSLVLVARTQNKLQALANRLTQQHGVTTRVIAQDLSAVDATATIMGQLHEAKIFPDILINNAGFATYGVFDALSLDRQREEIQLNCLSPVELTHALLPAMLKRGDGAVINVASTAAIQPDPYMAIYGATKAFLLSFSEALWAENRQRGVRVLALCPGATDTAFFDVVNAEEASVGKRMKADAVVSQALKALDKQRNYLITGCNNWLLGQLQRFVTRRRLLIIAEGILRPKAQR
ncbi:SDR family NAD(P)-dependent oxidoreductase [Rouxiella badensis]|jgi:short-subunit dehydrogenase|uniref:SDR family NAD(P)-dependent oxidoreductase n=2 Tax=Rouxiella badensis TaxID=1646377 RepID=UPI000380E45B|nr:SDR family oxidoreductase [Rouxiella badensis]MCC3746314.1 SDR family oxidoreductase [Rouxiella badensis]WAT09738.1 SDR family oxidoreductase [Rouxiella badensis]